MHVLFIAPETGRYNERFVYALKQTGARVTGVGHCAEARLGPGLRALLDGYVTARSLLDEVDLVRIAREIDGRSRVERVETIDEPAIVPAARVREALGVPGLTVATATLCRDKAAMKDARHAAGIPCAASGAATDRDGAFAFAGHEGLDDVARRFGPAIFEQAIPRSGALTQPLERGWHAGTWFRLKDTNYDRLMARLAFIGEHVKIRLRA